jgi:hypothetical protein
MLKQLRNDIEISRAFKQARKCRKLHMSSPAIATWDYEVKAENGKVVEKCKQLTHSYTRNFHNWLALNTMFIEHSTGTIGTTYDDGSLRLIQISGTGTASGSNTICIPVAGSSSAGRVDGGYGIFGGAGISTLGIVFGTDGTAESLNDYQLGSLLTHSAGVREYLTMTKNNPAFDSSAKKWSTQWNRVFRNLSGEDIEVAEIGLIATLSATTTIQYSLIIRDVLSSPITVKNNQRLSWTYELAYVI